MVIDRKIFRIYAAVIEKTNLIGIKLETISLRCISTPKEYLPNFPIKMSLRK